MTLMESTRDGTGTLMDIDALRKLFMSLTDMTWSLRVLYGTSDLGGTSTGVVYTERVILWWRLYAEVIAGCLFCSYHLLIIHIVSYASSVL